MAVNDRLLSNAIMQSIALQRYNNREVKQITKIFNKEIMPDLINQIQRRFGKGQVNWTTKRLEKLRDIIRETFKLNKLYRKNKGDLIDLSKGSSNSMAGALNNVGSSVGLEFVTPNIQALRQMVINQPFQGKMLRAWYSDLTSSSQKEIMRQLQIGVGEGETVRQMTDRIEGTAAQAFTDGTGQVVRNHIATIVRTASNHVNNQARLQTMEENEELLKGWRFTATLDANTSEICMQYDGNLYQFDDPTAPVPPLHPNCRSTPTPVMKSAKELGLDLAETPEGTRASFDGQVPKKTKYPEWLRSQPESVQNKALGKVRAEMWREGKIKISEFTNDRNQLLNLKQLDREGFDVPKEYAVKKD